MNTIEQIARAFWEAEVSRDLDRIVSFFTPDAELGKRDQQAERACGDPRILRRLSGPIPRPDDRSRPCLWK